MPTVLRIDGLRVFFYSNEGSEPPHVHVRQGDREAKIWLQDMQVAVSTGYAAHELNAIVGLLEPHREELLVKWNEHFGD